MTLDLLLKNILALSVGYNRFGFVAKYCDEHVPMLAMTGLYLGIVALLTSEEIEPHFSYPLWIWRDAGCATSSERSVVTTWLPHNTTFSGVAVKP